MRCPNCEGEDTTNIVIKLRDDDDVSFFQCRRCESKWWQHDGETIALDQVLDLTAQSEVKVR
jgi:formate dehydrogenase maturation protein FdhE